MAFLKDFVRPTAVVRNIMKHYGRSSELVFTNSYKHCRTVKCYGYSDQMVEEISSALRLLGVKSFDVKARCCGYGRSTIVRIPRSEQK